MLASELIKELQRIIKEYGDCPVIIPFSDDTDDKVDISFVSLTECNKRGLIELE